MKNCILTPTFVGHFQYLHNYLKSFRQNVTDKDKCVIFFIINKDENGKLQKITSAYKDIDIRILHLEDILQKYNINLSPEELLIKYGKFSFQAIKKFYGMLYLKQYQRFLVLDTESIWLNKTCMCDMFHKFFDENPFIIYSNISKRLAVSPSNKRVSEDINYIFGSQCDKWFVEQYVRFWDVNILQDLFDRYGSCFEIVDKIYKKENNTPPQIGLFESVLYDQFVYENNQKYNYRLIDLDQACENSLSADVLFRYRKNMAAIWKGSCGLLESSSVLFDKDNYQGFARVFAKNNLNIIRIETEMQNYIWQKKFLEIVKPNILTCSQENLFGVNKTWKNWWRIILLNSRKYDKLKKHIHIVIQPIKISACWLFSLLMVPLDICKLFKEILTKLAILMRDFWQTKDVENARGGVYRVLFFNDFFKNNYARQI